MGRVWAPRARSSIWTLGFSVALAAPLACGGVEDVDASAEQNVIAQWNPAPPADGNLRIATFNIRNYPFLPPDPDAPPRDPPLSHQLETDDEALLEVLSKLQFDVLAVQEIVDTERFTILLDSLSERTGRSYSAAFATNEHSGNSQHVGVLVADDAARIASSREYPEVDTRGTLRGGLSARIEGAEAGGIDFGMMVLHLASGSSTKRAELRAEQAAQVAPIVAAEKLESGDEDYLVMGDLNTARAPDELVSLDAAFFQVDDQVDSGLARQTLEQSCSAYWVKKSTNPLLRPSLLDHVYASSMNERDASVDVAAGAHCAEHHCEQYESTDALSGGSFWGVSDHCPVYFEVVDVDDDG
jgi:endonuclease/exonuclease/phosphatase family metal-dependent hydrolase